MHFQLVTTDGKTLRPIELARADWPAGWIFYRGEEPDLRVAEVAPAADREQFTVEVVEEA